MIRGREREARANYVWKEYEFGQGREYMFTSFLLPFLLTGSVATVPICHCHILAPKLCDCRGTIQATGQQEGSTTGCRAQRKGRVCREMEQQKLSDLNTREKRDYKKPLNQWQQHLNRKEMGLRGLWNADERSCH